MRQKIIKLISAMLIMTLTINIAQLEIFADTFMQNNVYDLSEGYTDEEISAELDTRLPKDGKPAVVIEELEEKRGKYTKYFLNDDFSYTAAQYNEPVHYQTDEGNWAEIDNSLVKAENENGETVYENKASDIKVQFGQDSHAEKLVNIDNGEFEISWGINNSKARGFTLFGGAGIKKSSFKVAELENNVATTEKTLTEAQAFRVQAAEEEIEEYNSDRMAVENAASAGEYKSILPNVDLKYELKGETVKENIVLNNINAADTDISFRIDHANLDMQANGDGSIALVSRKDGREIYRLDAPFMYDTAGETSSAVDMQIMAVTADESILTIVADKTWLKDASRVYPVIIDPITETAQTYTGIEDINVRENRSEPYEVSSRNLWVGRASNGDEFRSFVNFKDLPDIGKGSQVTGAVFRIFSYGDPNETADNKIFSVHKVEQFWNSDGLTWATQPYFSKNALDYTTYYKQPAYQGRAYDLDITQAARDWYNGYNDGTPEALGLAIKAYNPGNNEVMIFASSDVSSAESAVRPQIYISYRNHAGLEDYWTYHSVSSGNSGTAYINDFTGNLVFQTNGISIGDAVMPFSLYLTYNGSDVNTPATTHPTQRNRFGYGFRLNVVQRVDITGIENYPYSYTDGDGTKHYFGTDMKDEDGLGLTLSTETGDYWYKIVNKEETSTMQFDSQGYLRKITDNNGNWISFNYGPENGDHILRDITTNTGSVAILQYDNNGNGKLVSINDYYGRTMTFQYEQENFLTNIIYSDGTTTRFDYDGLGRLISAKNNDASGLEFKYYNDKVAKISESSSGYTQLRDIYSMAYSLYQTEFSDANDRVDVYQFNSLGLTTYMSSDDGISAIDYSTQRASRNKISSSAGTSWAGSAVNYLKNSDFSRDGKSDWIEMGNAEITGGALISGNVAKFTSTSASSNNELWQMPGLLKIPQHTTYTLSAYVRTTDVVGAGARIHAVMRDDVTNEPRVIYSEGINGTTNRDIDDGWQRLTLTFNMEQEEHFDRIGIGLCDATGTAEICNVQLEVGEIANPYNIILNGYFNIYDANNYVGTVPYGWNDPGPGYGSDELLQNIHYETTGITFKGDPTKSKLIMCGVPVSGNEGDVYYFSGALFGDAIIDGSRDVRISAAVIYTDGSVRWIDAKPNSNLADLQRFSAIINTDDNNPTTNLTYSAIHVYLYSINQINDIHFGGIELVKDFGGSYSYDNEGNQVSAIDKADQETSFAYDDNNTISKILNPDGTSYEYAKDDKKNVVTAFSSDGLSMDLTYDSFGNATSSKTQGISYVGAVIPGQKYYIRNKYSGKCLDLNGDRLVQNAQNKLLSTQKWEVVDAGGGYYALKSVYSRSIDTDGTA